jgi:hypothetical protein
MLRAFRLGADDDHPFATPAALWLRATGPAIATLFDEAFRA